MEVENNAFDLIICSHVLEHVDDRKALREMLRVLRPGGIALLMTPVVEGWSETYENPNVDFPKDRVLHFGQDDHVRYFGADIRDRIKSAGFELEEFTAVEPDVSRYSLIRGENLFIARKPKR
jgi:SAM-dependent methyltransferase